MDFLTLMSLRFIIWCVQKRSLLLCPWVPLLKETVFCSSKEMGSGMLKWKGVKLANLKREESIWYVGGVTYALHSEEASPLLVRDWQ